MRGSQSAYGCPTFAYPGGLTTNTYCIQCCECLQTCPEDNLAVNLRPWGSDLAVVNRPRTDEAYLALLMLSITAFHGLTMTPVWRQMTNWTADVLALGRLIAFSTGMAAIMVAPILVYAALVYVSYRLGNGRRTWLPHEEVRYGGALEAVEKELHLRALPAAVDTLKGDKDSLFHGHKFPVFSPGKPAAYYPLFRLSTTKVISSD